MADKTSAVAAGPSAPDPAALLWAYQLKREHSHLLARIQTREFSDEQRESRLNAIETGMARNNVAHSVQSEKTTMLEAKLDSMDPRLQDIESNIATQVQDAAQGYIALQTRIVNITSSYVTTADQAQMQQQVDELKQGLANNVQQIEAMENQAHGREIEQVHERLEGVTQQVHLVENLTQGLEKKFAAVETANSELRKANEALEKKFASIERAEFLLGKTNEVLETQIQNLTALQTRHHTEAMTASVTAASPNHASKKRKRPGLGSDDEDIPSAPKRKAQRIERAVERTAVVVESGQSIDFPCGSVTNNYDVVSATERASVPVGITFSTPTVLPIARIVKGSAAADGTHKSTLKKELRALQQSDDSYIPSSHIELQIPEKEDRKPLTRAIRRKAEPTPSSDILAQPNTLLPLSHTVTRRKKSVPVKPPRPKAQPAKPLRGGRKVKQETSPSARLDPSPTTLTPTLQPPPPPKARRSRPLSVKRAPPIRHLRLEAAIEESIGTTTLAESQVLTAQSPPVPEPTPTSPIKHEIAESKPVPRRSRGRPRKPALMTTTSTASTQSQSHSQSQRGTTRLTTLIVGNTMTAKGRNQEPSFLRDTTTSPYPAVERPSPPRRVI